MTTAPRLWLFEPEVTVQRVRFSVGVGARVSVIGLPPRGRAGADGGRPGRLRLRGREMALVTAPQLGPRLPDRVLERIGQGRRRRGDDVGVAAHGGPGPRPVRGVD